MKTKIQIKSIFGSIRFEYETENNTTAKTLEQAVKEGVNLIGANLEGADLEDANLEDANLRDVNLEDVNLRGANLRGADLRGANLIDVNLRGANLRGADLRGANLEGANLIGVNLIGANLEGADLRDANLRDANLIGVNLRGAIKLPIYCSWSIGITDNQIHIGCEKGTIEEWDLFFASDKVLNTERNTPEFKQIKAAYEGYKAYYLALQLFNH